MKLQNEKIRLRKLNESDLDFIYEMTRQFLVYQYEEDHEPTEAEVLSKFRGKIKKMEYQQGESFTLLIVRIKDNIPLGEVHIHLDNKQTRCWEIGYSLHPEYWGHGYASGAVNLLIQYAFESLNAHKILGCCNGNNIKSAKCMERVGMKQEGCIREGRLLRDEWCDEYVYSILDKDYFSRKNPGN